jgi:hypothetical protein
MIGNPYNYENFFAQTKIFDIDTIHKITNIELYFFQNNNFRDINNNLISGNENYYNIFVKDFSVSFGYDVSGFDNDTLILYSSDSSIYDVPTVDKNKFSFEENHKKIEVRWIHRFENGNIKVVD